MRLILETPTKAAQNIALAIKKLLKHLDGEIDPAKAKRLNEVEAQLSRKT
jgi:hypothetical protein